MPSFRTTHRVPFTPRQMFDLVADLESYPAFLPLCEAVIVRRREQHDGLSVIIADMTVAYLAIRETFSSRVELDASNLAVVARGAAGTRGPFRQLENRWRFRTATGGCDVEFFISYTFKSLVFELLVGSLFARLFRRYTEAFEARAHHIYGAEGAAARHDRPAV